MTQVRLIPVVILAVAALLVLKTLGLVTTGSYVLGGVTVAQAEEHAAAKPAEGGASADGTLTLPSEPTMADSSPTLDDSSPTLGQGADAASGGDHAAAPAEGEHAAAPAAGDHAATPAAEGGAAAPAEADHAAAPATNGHATDGALPAGLQVVCPPTDTAAPAADHAADPAADHAVDPATAAAPAEATPAVAEAAAPAEGGHTAEPAATDFAAGMTTPDCVPLVDAVPMQIGPDGVPVPLVQQDGQSMSEKAILERLAARRTELETYQQELDLRASLVDAAEKKVQERQATLEALQTQISTLVDQRKDLESGQFTGIISLYENMKPKDAANIFNSLDMEVLLRVAKGMNPRKMSPILAAMDATRAQELTVRMAALADLPPEQMTPADVSALPQIVGQ